MPASPLAPLDYAPARSVARRWGRRLIVVVVLLAVGVAGWRWWPDVDRWQSLARLRRAVLVATVVANGPAVAMTPTDLPDAWLSAFITRLPDDRIWRLAHAEVVPPVTGGEPGPPVLLFLHERDTPAGVRRAVVVHLEPMTSPDAAYFSLHVRLFDPGTVWHPMFREVTVGPVVGLRVDGSYPAGYRGARYGLGRVVWGHAVSFAVGRPDPADPSQFLLDYTLDGRAGQIIGRLRDDDGVAFRTADGSPLPLRAGPPRKPRPG